MSRVVIAFGQFGAAADPVNLPAFNARVQNAGHETILVQHDATAQAVDFLRAYAGKVALVGASLGAASVVVWARYLSGRRIDFVGGFQPSDFDPSMHEVAIEGPDGDVITRAVTVTPNVGRALCFRNPVLVGTGGLGHATYVVDPDNKTTLLAVVNRPDVHPGDFGPAADQMLRALTEALK